MSFDRAIEGTQLSKLRRIDPAMTATVIDMLIVDTYIHFGAMSKTNEFEIGMLVKKILASYWWMKLEEIVYVFNGGKMGKYGKMYHALNHNYILEWFRTYDTEERGNFILNENLKQKEERTESDKDEKFKSDKAEIIRQGIINKGKE